MAYSDGQALRGGVPLGDNDFYFRVAFAPNDAPVETTVNLDFREGAGRGVIVNASGALTTDCKFAAVFVLDDTRSSAWSDPAGRRAQEIEDFITTLWNRTSGTGPYYLSHADWWAFSTTELERTSGYERDLATLQLLPGTLFEAGTNSNLFETAAMAISGLNPQSIVDAYIRAGEDNSARVGPLVDYLQSRSLLDLDRVTDYWNSLGSAQSAWDGQASTIKDYDDVSQFVVEEWAKTFSPVIFVIADGDSTEEPEDAILTAQTAWDADGVSVHCFGLGASHRQIGLRRLASETGGRHFHIAEGGDGEDWDTSFASFLHGAANSLFSGVWTQHFDYTTPTWIRKIYADFTAPSAGGSSAVCRVEVRWSTNRLHFTPWQTVPDQTDVMVEEEVLALQYRVTLEEGWDSGAPLRPVLSSLYHISVEPSRQYLITPLQKVSGMLFEHLLSAAQDLPASARVTWGICRGDSVDFADYEPVINHRRAALPSRQRSLQFTPEKQRLNLRAERYQNSLQVYQVFEESGAIATWTEQDEVFITIGGFVIPAGNASYSLDGTRGLIYFATEQSAAIQIRVDIITPPQLYHSDGEPTTTRDGRTYYLMNGRWTPDCQAIVLKNGAIVRGGYWENAEEGAITFHRELERTDIVTVFILHPGLYRVGVEIRNYTTTPVTLSNFGLYYTTVPNRGVLHRYTHTSAPSVKNVKLVPAAPTVDSRLSVEYTFVSPENNAEQGTEILWYRKMRSGETASSYPLYITDLSGDLWFPLLAENNLPDYRNRTVARLADIEAGTLFQGGDAFLVTVTPSDGFKTGEAVSSRPVTIAGNHAPFVKQAVYNPSSEQWEGGPFIDGVGRSEFPAGSGQYVIPESSALMAVYEYEDADGDIDRSVVEWRIKDGEILGTGKTLAAGVARRGQAISFTVTPYDGVTYGIPVSSDIITIAQSQSEG